MTDIVDKLREQIDAEHEEAIRALTVLRRYLSKTQQPPPQAITIHQNGIQNKPQEKAVGVAEQVRTIIAHEWAGVGSICAKTGFTIKRVRGFLNAPRMRGKIDKRPGSGGVIEYRMKAGSGKEENEESRSH